ncbi:MFS transporter [Streptomyces sp. SCSIO 30461]|uniref:MFS transporter n=1 Tax=Streptomyces sp. SCSIO 30461 TaxID=3118085 RepID=UPI0030D0A174
MTRHAAVRPAPPLVPTLVRSVYLPRAADAAAFAMATYGIPLLVLATTGSATLTGLAFALEWTPRLAAFAVAGALVDRIGTARVTRWASLARAVVVVAAAGLLSQQTGSAAIVTVMALAALTGVLSEFSYIAVETAGSDASRRAGNRAHRVQSVLLGIDQSATLTGPAAAGLLLQHSGPYGMLLVLAACSILAAALAPGQQHQPTGLLPVAAGLRTGWSTLRSLPALAWLVTGLVVSNISIGLLQAATPVIVVSEFGHTTAQAGLIWSAAAGASLLAVTAARLAIDRYGLWPVGAAFALLATGAALAVAHAHTYYAYMLLIAALMAGEGGLTVVLRTLRSHLIPPQVFGATLALTILLLTLPFPLAGLLVAAVTPGQLGTVITAAAVLQALGLLTVFARLRTLPIAHPRPA